MPISNRETFAIECVLQGLFLGINPHYLMATAELRSGIKDDTQGDQIGPFRIVSQVWAANAVEHDLNIELPPEDIGRWRAQCLFAALTALRAQNRLMESLGHAPSVAELYPEHWPDDANRPVAELQAALESTAAFIDPAMKQVVGEVSATLRDAQDSPAAVTVGPAMPTPKESEALFVTKAPGIMDKLIADLDLEDFHAAGVLGNIGHECAGFQTMQEVRPRRGKGGFGWCQWTASRRRDFESFCRKNGYLLTSDAGNYAFLKQELETTHASSLEVLKATKTLPDAVREFEKKFEVAAADAKHYDRRDRWATLALGAFAKRLPPNVAKLVDPDATFTVVATAKSGTTTYWVLEETDDDGGQVLIRQTGDQQPEILARDTTVFPITSDKVPDAVGKQLSRGLSPGDPSEPPGAGPSASGADTTAKLAAEARKCSGTLVSRNVDNTNHGRLACAWAVNEVARRALGKTIGGGLRTSDMAKVLKEKHELVPESRVSAGMVVISPTQGENIGHVGIIGDIKSPVSESLIYSNSSQHGVFEQNYTIKRWKASYKTRKRLPVLYYSIKT